MTAKQTQNDKREHGGYKCPECFKPMSCIETRASGNGVRRRRECKNGHRITTYEMAGEPDSTRIAELQSKMRQVRGAALAFLAETE